MNDEPLTGEEIRNWRRQNFWRGFGNVFWVAPLAAVTTGIGSKVLEEVGVSRGLPANVMHAAVGPLFFLLTINAYIWLLYRKQDSHEVIHERLLRQRVDRYQTRWRLALIAFVVAASWLTFQISTQIDKFVRDPGKDSLPFMYAAAMASLAAMACQGPSYFRPAIRKGLNDELTKKLRHQSVVAGYFCVMFLLCASFAVILFRPDLTVTILLWLIFAGAAIPLLGYTFLDWRADLGDG